MSQALSQFLGQHMRLEQRLTPQLIQSMEILQLSMPALEARIAEELEKNVTLEIADSERLGTQADKQPTDGDAKGTDSDRFGQLDKFSQEYDGGLDDGASFRPSGQRVASGERDAKLDAMANTEGRAEGIDEHLLKQWSLMDMDDETRRAGEAIIYHLEEDGYLKTPLEEVARSADPELSVEVVESALGWVQRLDPVGVAARDFKECLLIQLEQLPGDNRIERTLIESHLEEIARNKYPAIAKTTGYSVGEISAAVDVIRDNLVLHPAHLVIEKRVPRVYPDVIIEEDDKGKSFVVRLSRGNLPDLQIKKEFIEMAKAKSNGKDVRDFVRKQVDSASTLIEAVKFRKGRLAEVAEAVVRYQSDFLDNGPSGLKILLMSDLAEELGCDPSTVSRTVSDKYVQTPQGIYPLRYFFTGGTSGGGGSEGTSWDSIKTRVRGIVKEEDPKHPLSDEKIVKILTTEGIEISRRTVAKYRSQLDIPPARQRRQF